MAKIRDTFDELHQVDYGIGFINNGTFDNDDVISWFETYKDAEKAAFELAEENHTKEIFLCAWIDSEYEAHEAYKHSDDYDKIIVDGEIEIKEV